MSGDGPAWLGEGVRVPPLVRWTRRYDNRKGYDMGNAFEEINGQIEAVESAATAPCFHYSGRRLRLLFDRVEDDGRLSAPEGVIASDVVAGVALASTRVAGARRALREGSAARAEQMLAEVQVLLGDYVDQAGV